MYDLKPVMFVHMQAYLLFVYGGDFSDLIALSMFNMDSPKKHLRRVRLHCSAGEICATYGNGTTTIRAVHNWCKKFREFDFDLKDEDRSGRPATMDTDLIKSMLAENWRYGMREVVDAGT